MHPVAEFYHFRLHLIKHNATRSCLHAFFLQYSHFKTVTLFLSFCFCASARACGSVCGILAVFLFQRLDEELKAERVDSISVNTVLPLLSLQRTGKGRAHSLRPEQPTFRCRRVLLVYVSERDSKRHTICYKGTKNLTIKLVATYWRQFNRNCDASLHIKSKCRNQTLLLTYSTSAQHNIDNGSTTPTCKPLLLVSLLHTQKTFRCTTEHDKHCVI